MVTRLIINRVDGTEQDCSAIAPVFDSDGSALMKMGMQWADGAASQGEALFVDDTGNQLNGTISLPGHGLATMIEDVTGCSYWLHRGRRSNVGFRRGARKGGNATDIPFTSDDCNVELRNPHFTEDWVRPEETTYARLVALQAYQMNGASSTAPHHRDSFYRDVQRHAPHPVERLRDDAGQDLRDREHLRGRDPRLRRDGRQAVRAHHPPAPEQRLIVQHPATGRRTAVLTVARATNPSRRRHC